jgi:hypothetical protein
MSGHSKWSTIKRKKEKRGQATFLGVRTELEQLRGKDEVIKCHSEPKAKNLPVRQAGPKVNEA